jgi:hypothetical protein
MIQVSRLVKATIIQSLSPTIRTVMCLTHGQVNCRYRIVPAPSNLQATNVTMTSSQFKLDRERYPIPNVVGYHVLRNSKIIASRSWHDLH